MVQCVHESAFAKVNLGLKVLPKRADGYHEIESIFQLIPLSDQLQVQCIPNKPECKVVCSGMELPQKNTLTAAYKAFRTLTGISDGVSVVLKKNIPSGAGLGGGSSDAAALVRVLCKMFNKNLTDSQLAQIASSVGSDVFFFLLCKANGNSGCAIVSGRGENVYPISPRRDLHFVLINPCVHSSTAKAYELVDGFNKLETIESFPEFSALEAIYRKSPKEWSFLNSFSEPLKKEYPVIAEVIEDIRKTGALFVQMTGSGSSVYGVFSDKLAAERAFNELCGKWKLCFLLASF